MPIDQPFLFAMEFMELIPTVQFVPGASLPHPSAWVQKLGQNW